MKLEFEHVLDVPTQPFSILERIDVGETIPEMHRRCIRRELSVSSNGSTWVKLRDSRGRCTPDDVFQYPRTDRRG